MVPRLILGSAPLPESFAKDGLPVPQEALRRIAELKAEYESLLAVGNGIPALNFETRFFPISDYLTNVEDDDRYMANSAGGFWVRRSIDGTQAQVFDLVQKVLAAFEPEVLDFRPADPPELPERLR